MAKYTFRYDPEWNEGQLPCSVILPNSERVEIDEAARAAYPELTETQCYIQINVNVHIRESHWRTRDIAKETGTELEIMAPMGSTFMFKARCPQCGHLVDESEISQDISVYHESCLDMP